MSTRVDVLVVGLGSTGGLRAAEDELVASMRRAGAEVMLVRPEPVPAVRTLALTDLLWARAARATTVQTLAAIRSPGAILYCTTTAALLWPRPGAIRFDAPAAGNRSGRHGIWQRPVEARRLRQAPLLIPWTDAALLEAGRPTTPSVTVPVPVDRSSNRPTTRDIAAITYGTNPHKKGLDRVLDAFTLARRTDERLIVAGLDGPADGIERTGVDYVGTLERSAYRALLRRAKIYVTAPRREDYGIAQLEALADGCRLVTTPAPGPYAALPLITGGLGWVVPPHGLRAAIRSALDDNDDSAYAANALAAIAPFRLAAVDAVVADRLLPMLLNSSSR